MQIRFAIASAALCAAILVLMLFFYRPTPPYMQGGRFDLPKAVAYWKEEIAREGPRQAYATMLEQAWSLRASIRHTLTHSFGEALYETGGIADIQYCGEEFLAGCFHQFIGSATLEFGAAVIPQLKSACDAGQDGSQCAHGIGHGLLSAYGYTFPGLTASLSACDRLYGSPNVRSDCAIGAFMEYNLQEITTLDDGRVPRSADGSNYEPCASIPAEFKNECAYELPLWWYALEKSASVPEHARYAPLGEMCRDMPDQSLRAPCFVGVGYPVAQHQHFSVPSVEQACTSASKTHQELVECLAGAANRAYLNLTDASQVCAQFGLAGAEQAYCQSVETKSLRDALRLQN